MVAANETTRVATFGLIDQRITAVLTDVIKRLNATLADAPLKFLLAQQAPFANHRLEGFQPRGLDRKSVV